MLFVDFLVLADELFQLICRQVGVFLGFVFFLDRGQSVFKMMMLKCRRRPHDDVAKHVDEAAIAVPAGSRVSGLLDEAKHRFVIHAEVQNGIHHARHGLGGTRTNGNQQRVFRVAQFLAFEFFQLGQVAV